MAELNPASSKIALLAGSGTLPIQVASNICKQNLFLMVCAADKATIPGFKKAISANDIILPVQIGHLQYVIDNLILHGITDVVFAGKVNKWVLLKNPTFDSKAMSLWQKQKNFNDDALMQLIIDELTQININVLEQTRFMQGLLAPAGVYSQRQLTAREEADAVMGMELAREMGRLDVGQTVVVSNGMVLAVEAVEGTDEAIKRAGRFKGKQGGVVAKVEKPNQDLRFDVPTVGPKTLATLKKAGLTVLAVEAGKTIMLEQEKMIQLANKWNISLVAR